MPRAALSDRDVPAREAELHDRLAAIVRGLPQARDVALVGRNGRPLLAAREFTVLAKPLTQAALAEAISRPLADLPPPRVVVDNTRRM